jgi:hypothetical protein
VYWTIGLLVIFLLTFIEIYKFINHKETFRLFIMIPLVLYIVVATPIAQYVPVIIDTALRICGIVFIIIYFWYVSRKNNSQTS